MAKQAGMGDRFWVDGYNLSGDIGSLSNIGGGPAAGEVTAIDKFGIERIGLLRSGQIEFSSWFDKAAGAEHLALAPLPTADRIATYGRGAAIGAHAAACVAKQINYDPTRAADGSLSLTISAQSNGFGLEWGEMLTAGTRTDTTATSPATGLDYGATSTLFGAQAYLQVEAVTGTSVTVTIQDSADNATFAAIAGGSAFLAATTRGAQRLVMAGTIRRYVRAITTGTFSNAQFQVTFVRNLTAVSF